MPPAVAETLLYLVHGLDGRNAAHASWGGVLLVDPGLELMDAAEVVGIEELAVPGVGVAFPGPSAVLSPHDVNNMPRNRRETVNCHIRVRFIVLPLKVAAERSLYADG